MSMGVWYFCPLPMPVFLLGYIFILNLVENNSTKNLLIASFWVIIVSFIDIRVALLIMLSALLWIVIVKISWFIVYILYRIILSSGHLFWILPALKTGISLPGSYGGSGNVEQFSFFPRDIYYYCLNPIGIQIFLVTSKFLDGIFVGIPLLTILALGFAKTTPKYKLTVALVFIIVINEAVIPTDGYTKIFLDLFSFVILLSLVCY